MIDPIGGFERIRDFYITYLETAFRIDRADVTGERRMLLETPGSLCTEPLIEPNPRYSQVGWSMSEFAQYAADQVADVGADEAQALQSFLLSGLFDSGDIALYEHQEELLRRGLSSGTPGVVTSGTGSGKTESFLLPILSSIFLEGRRKWPKPAEGYLRSRWWHDGSGRPVERFTDIDQSQRPLQANPHATPFRAHREGESPERPAAVRALILYPMNALVEDQLARLRRAIDSPAARALLDEQLDGNRIFVGRYTGATPVTGFHEHPRKSAADYRKTKHGKLEDLFWASKDAERTQDHLTELVDQGRFDEEDKYLFPSVDGGELLSRWDMQATPPDILITNVSMLSAMLNREVDAPVFDKTADWLASDPEAYFYLVLDELHLHRGTAGTEVAYLVRLLLHRLGLTDPTRRHQLRILASSASLPDHGEAAEQSERYLHDMFGSHGWAGEHPNWIDAIVGGTPVVEESATSELLDAAPFVRLVDELAPMQDLVLPIHLDGVDVESLLADVLDALSVDGEGFEDRLRCAVEEAGRRLHQACWDDEEGRSRAYTVSTVAERVFGDEAATLAVRGLLLVRGLADAWDQLGSPDNRPNATAFRIHTFFRAIEGLYASIDEGRSAPDSLREQGRRFGQLTIERGQQDTLENPERGSRSSVLRKLRRPPSWAASNVGPAAQSNSSPSSRTSRHCQTVRAWTASKI